MILLLGPQLPCYNRVSPHEMEIVLYALSKRVLAINVLFSGIRTRFDIRGCWPFLFLSLLLTTVSLCAGSSLFSLLLFVLPVSQSLPE